jgi:hypothetical protein
MAEDQGARRAATPGEAPGATPLLYVDVDDEITSAAARIRAAEADELALVLPYGSRLATSRINFRLLAREATERGKKIEIVSADTSARALAAAAGLPVHASVAAFEGHKAGIPVDGDGDVDAEAETGTAGRAAGNGTGMSPETVDDDTETRVLAVPRRRPERVPLVGPPRPPIRTGLAVGIGLAAILLVLTGGMLALELLPSATIVLAPRSEPIGPIELSVEARLDATAPDPAIMVIPAQRVTFLLEATQTITATGIKVVDTKATGEVTFSNFDTGGGVLIPAGTIVRTESDIEFRTLSDLTLPKATFDFFPPFSVHPSTGDVGIEAVVAGESGNVGNNAINEIPKAKRTLAVTNQEPTTGGAHTESPEISEADVTAAIAAIDGALETELARQVSERIGVPEGVEVFEQSQVVGERQYSTDPATLVGSAETEVELSASAEGSILGVDPTPIQAIAESRLQSRVTAGWSLAPGSIVVDRGEPRVFGDIVSYPVTITAAQIHDVDQALLIGQVRGLVLAEARARLDDYGDVEISLWPDWVTTIPKNVDRITFTLVEPQPAPSPTP